MFTKWIGKDDCMEHPSGYQYWRRGKRYCLGCLRDEVEEHLRKVDLFEVDDEHSYNYPCLICRNCGKIINICPKCNHWKKNKYLK